MNTRQALIGCISQQKINHSYVNYIGNKTFVLYTPKIIKFQTPNHTLSQQQPRTLNKTIQKSLKCQTIDRNGKKITLVKKLNKSATEKQFKMKVISKLNQSKQSSSRYSAVNPFQSQPNRFFINQEEKQTKQRQMMTEPQHITVQEFIPNCDLFGIGKETVPNDWQKTNAKSKPLQIEREDSIVIDQHKTAANEESTFMSNSKQIKSRVRIFLEKTKVRENIPQKQIIKRNKIFSMSKGQSLLNISQQRTISLRRSIFQKIDKRVSKTFKEVQAAEVIDIPNDIFASWQKMENGQLQKQKEKKQSKIPIRAFTVDRNT